MSQKDKIKEQIGFLKLLFSLVGAMLITLGSWLINHIGLNVRFIAGLSFFAILLLIEGKFFFEIYKNIKKLEEL